MVTKKVSKDRFFGGFFLDVSKLCWQKLPEEVCGCSGESLLHRREFEALRRGTSDHLLAWGNFWSSPSVTAHPFSKGKAHVVLRGPPTICVDGRWWRELRFGGARAEAKMGRGARGKCVSAMGVTRRHGNECHQWRFTSSVVTPRCFWCTAVRIALKSPSVSATSCSLSNVLVMQPQKIVLQIFHKVIWDSERF